MARSNETLPFGAAGSGNLSLLASLDTPESSPPHGEKQAALLDPATAVVIAAWAELPRELLAESVELALGYGANILAAIRRRDDHALLAEFAAFDAAARTARHCAEKLREKQRFLESGGQQ